MSKKIIIIFEVQMNEKYLLEMDENDQRQTQWYQTQYVSDAIHVKW